MVARTGYCGADESYEAVSFGYPTIWVDNEIINGGSGTCHTNATYTYYSDTKTLVISGVGDFMAGMTSVRTSGSNSTYKMTLPATGYGDLYKEVEHVVIEDGITNIPAGAFYNFAYLKDVEFGNDIELIGKYAFINDASLTEIELPDSLVTIEENPFHNCSGIRTFRIGTGLKNLGSVGFMTNCEKLYYDAIDAKCTKNSTSGNDYCAFGNLGANIEGGVELYIGSEVTKIPDYFSQITGSTLTSIPNWGKVIFSNAGNLKEIGYRAIVGSKYIEELEIPDGVNTISNSAFSSNTNLISVYIPDSVEILDSAFSDCQKTVIYCQDSESQEGWVQHWNYYNENKEIPTIYNVTREEYDNIYSASLTDVIVPEYMSEIEGYAFYNHKNLVNIEMSNSVTGIGEHAFSGCISLQNVNLSNNLTSIGGYAFYNCISLDNVRIPDGITVIEEYTFCGCTSITLFN